MSGVPFTVETRGGRIVAEAEGLLAARVAARTLLSEGETNLYLRTSLEPYPLERWYLGGGRRGGGRAETYIACETSDLARRYDGRA